MTNPERPEPNDFIAPLPQEVTHPEQVTGLDENASPDQLAGGLPPTDDVANQVSDITQTEPEAAPDQHNIPPRMLEAAGRAIDMSTSAYSGHIISFGKLLHRAFGDEPLSSHEFAHFKRALKGDPRTSYKGKGRYLI